jgi:hypothetical protein
VGTGIASSVGHRHRTSAEFLAALIYTRAEQLRVPNNRVFIAERTDKVVDVFKVPRRSGTVVICHDFSSQSFRFFVYRVS